MPSNKRRKRAIPSDFEESPSALGIINYAAQCPQRQPGQWISKGTSHKLLLQIRDCRISAHLLNTVQFRSKDSHRYRRQELDPKSGAVSSVKSLLPPSRGRILWQKRRLPATGLSPFRRGEVSFSGHAIRPYCQEMQPAKALPAINLSPARELAIRQPASERIDAEDFL